LRIAVDDQHPPAGLGERRTQVRGRGRLRDPALVVGQDDHERARRRQSAVVCTGSFTSVCLYVYMSVYMSVYVLVFTCVVVERCGDGHTASL